MNYVGEVSKSYKAMFETGTIDGVRFLIEEGLSPEDGDEVYLVFVDKPMSEVPLDFLSELFNLNFRKRG